MYLSCLFSSYHAFLESGSQLGTLDVGNEVTLNTRDKLLLFGLLGLFLAKWFLNGCPLIVQQAFVGCIKFYYQIQLLLSGIARHFIRVPRGCLLSYKFVLRLHSLCILQGGGGGGQMIFFKSNIFFTSPHKIT